MNSSTFVDAIKSEVCEAASLGTIAQLRAPSGRRPAEKLRRLSTWFNQLAKVDQQAVMEVAAMASGHAVFGFFCVLDGVRSILEGEQTGRLHLSFVEPGKPPVMLNADKGEMLHELFNAQ